MHFSYMSVYSYVYVGVLFLWQNESFNRFIDGGSTVHHLCLMIVVHCDLLMMVVPMIFIC